VVCASCRSVFANPTTSQSTASKAQTDAEMKELNPANVKFMLDHEEHFKKMQADWAALGK
jgi:hypothetical protein